MRTANDGMNRGSLVRKLPARKLLGAIIAAALFLPETAFTLGLGEIEVNSALNQKLNADIELLSAEPDDAEKIIIKLASRKEFTRAGLDRPYLLNDLRFKSEVIDGVPHIKVTSNGPIREPFLNFLVEIDWPNGHMLREYTVLLDPPVFMTKTASTATKSAAGGSEDAGFRPSSGGSANVVPAPVTGSGFAVSYRPVAGDIEQPQTQPAAQLATNPAFVPAPVFQQQTSMNQPVDSYRIQSGDTAWSLARAMRPEQTISVEQMMIAMLRANPESFINENINGLKRGYILRVPDYNQIVSINPEDARALVREQAALWRQYQQSQSGGQPASAMSNDEMSANGEQSEDALANGEDDAYLEIVSAGSGSSTMSGKDPTDMSAQELRAELALARERIETERVEKEALQQRIDSLEQNVGKMKGMLSIEDDQLSDVQQLGLSAEEAAVAADIEAEIQDSTLDEILDQAEAEAESSAEMAADTVVEDPFAADMNVDGEEAAAEDAAVFLDKTSAEDMPADLDATEESAAELDQAEPSIDDVAPEQPPVNPLDKLLSDPVLLAAAGGGLLLIIAIIALVIKRRKASTETDLFEMDTSDAGLDNLADDVAAEAIETKSLIDDQPKESDVADEDDFDSDLATNVDATDEAAIARDKALSDADGAESRDDVIAEADVYLAYGIYQQAEELLTQAIADSPERDDYRVKLAETHYASKNEEAFVKVATELKTRIDDESPEWNKVMGMGQDLCADNPLFQGRMVSGLDVNSMSEKEPKMDFDLGIDGSDNSGDVDDLNLSMDDEALELPEMGIDETEKDAAVTEPVDELEFDLSDTGAFVATPEEEDEFSLDIDAAELDIDASEQDVETSVLDIDASELDIDGSTSELQEKTENIVSADDLDLDFGLDDKTPTDEANDEEIALDLTEDTTAIDLDMGTAGTDSDDQADEEDFDLSTLDDVDEISTKLDLARAYLDMGDHEGTREILEEVLTEGNDDQKQEANELLAKVG